MAAIEVETLARVAAIEQEVFDRGAAIGSEASARTTLATQLRGAYAGTDLASISSGLLFDERQARSTADASEVSTREALSAKLTGASDPTSLTLGTLSAGLLFEEREARATAVLGEASSRTALSTQLRGAYTGNDLGAVSSGLLYDERQARSTADASEVSARQSLSATLTGVTDPTALTLGTLSSGMLYEERAARASAVSAEASSRVSLATQLRGSYGGTDLSSISSGLLFDERQARSTADASEVSARQSLSAKLTGVNDPTSMTLGALSAGLIFEERTARVNAIAAEATRLDNLTASTAYLVADLAVESFVRASQVSGIHAQYTLKATATRSDGKKVFGLIGLAATAPNDGSGGESQIMLSADSLVFVPSSNVNAAPAQMLTLGLVNGVLTLSVPAAVIGDLTVATRAIENNATARLLAATTAYNTVASVTVVITEADIPSGNTVVPVLVIGSCVTGNASRFFDISVDPANYVAAGNLIASQPPVGGCWSVSLVYALGVGTHTFACFNHGSAAPAYDAFAIARTIAVLVSKK